MKLVEPTDQEKILVSQLDYSLQTLDKIELTNFIIKLLLTLKTLLSQSLLNQEGGVWLWHDHYYITLLLMRPWSIWIGQTTIIMYFNKLLQSNNFTSWTFSLGLIHKKYFPGWSSCLPSWGWGWAWQNCMNWLNASQISNQMLSSVCVSLWMFLFT